MPHSQKEEAALPTIMGKFDPASAVVSDMRMRTCSRWTW